MQFAFCVCWCRHCCRQAKFINIYAFSILAINILTDRGKHCTGTLNDARTGAGAVARNGRMSIRGRGGFISVSYRCHEFKIKMHLNARSLFYEMILCAMAANAVQYFLLLLLLSSFILRVFLCVQRARARAHMK